jgi:TM2 domain-containing membrane protein YozV
MRSAAGGGLLVGTQQVVLADSSLAKVNETNLRLLAKKQNNQLSRVEGDSLRAGLQQLGGHIAAKGHLDKQTKEAYRVALLANKPRPVSTKADKANQWDFAVANQGTPFGLDANSSSDPLVFGEGKVVDEPRWNQGPKEDIANEQLVAALLCFFLGFTGAHRFYLDYPNQGLIQLGITLIAILLVLVPLIVAFTTWTIAPLEILNWSAPLAFYSLLGLYVWLTVDFVRIITGELRKKKSTTQHTPEWQKNYEQR